MKRWARHHSRKDPGPLIDQVFATLSEQTVTVPGADAVELIIPRVAAQILLAAGDLSAFPTPGHLATYAGIAPVTRRSGTSIRGEYPARAGNKKLKNALFRSAWIASCHDPVSKAYYDRKRAEGKRHNAAIMCLARRRLNLMYAMMKTGTLYEPHTPAAA